MRDRIEAELSLLRQFYADLDYLADARWVRLPRFRLPSGWNRRETAVAWQIPTGYPGTPPYGIYVPAGLLFNGSRPNNYMEPARTQPPFGGVWGVFSWQPADGQWCATADPSKGANLAAWVRGFGERFGEGT